jgi:hypothetical protein
MRLATAAAAVFLASAALAQAAPKQCFAPSDIEAETAVRFQAELMVMSDTCGTRTYTDFARRNRSALIDYQKQVIERFRRSGQAHADVRFDNYLTRLANEVSLRSGTQPVATVCRNAAQLLATAEKLNDDGFRRYVADSAAVHRADYRSCGN